MIKVIELQPRIPGEVPSWNTMNLLKERAVRNVKQICYSGIFKHPTGTLAASIRGYVSGNAVYIVSDVTYAKSQEEGVRPHIMWYLLGKTIPIRSYEFGQSRLTFRKVTLKSYMRGGWRHPGYEGKYFMDRGAKLAVEEMGKELAGYTATVTSR